MRKNKIYFFLIFTSVFFLFPFRQVAHADSPPPPPSSSEGSSSSLNYTLLEKIPGASNGSDLAGYITALYNAALALIVLSAILMLTIGGFMYLTSAGNTSLAGTAKGVITDALIGLIIAIVAYLVLYVINPELVKVTLTSLPSTATGGGAGTGTGSPPPPGSGGGGGNCGGFSTQSDIDSQCGDVSPKLSDVLKCMHDRYPSAVISSISDSAGFTKCKTAYAKPPCAHAQTSCHYGGGASQTDPECQKSQAADFSIKGAEPDKIKMAAGECGGRVNDETASSAPHIHVSAQTSCCGL